MDERLFFLINRRWTHPALDRMMIGASSINLWMPLIVLALILTAYLGRRRAWAFLLTLAVTVALGDSVIGNSLKHWLHRPRPPQVMADVRQVDLARNIRPFFLTIFRPLLITYSPAPPVRKKPAQGRSFPSSHTVNNFCAAVILTIFYRRWGWLYFFPALLVAYSRVYVGAHWPSDVFVSAWLAAGIALLTTAAVQAVWKRFGPRI